MPLGQQQKLLRVLETGEFERLGSSRTRRGDVRLISATNADLHAEVAAGRFRQDLLFRLNTIEVHLPPLRERREDIARLAAHFLSVHAQRYRKSITTFEPAALVAAARAPVARQRARARSRGGARRADGAGAGHPGGRPRPAPHGHRSRTGSTR